MVRAPDVLATIVAESPTGPAPDIDSYIAGIDVATVSPYAEIADGKGFYPGTLRKCPTIGKTMDVTFLDNHIFSHSARRIRPEPDFPEVQTGRRHQPFLAVSADPAVHDTVTTYLVSRF